MFGEESKKTGLMRHKGRVKISSLESLEKIQGYFATIL